VCIPNQHNEDTDTECHSAMHHTSCGSCRAQYAQWKKCIHTVSQRISREAEDCVLAKCCSLCRVLFCIYGEPYGLVQASSSPLSPLQSRHASAALSENLGAGCDMSRAVSAKPFSIQHSIDMHKVAYPQQHALAWLQVSEPSACQHGKADAVSDQSPQTQQEDKEGQLQLGKRTPLKTPFSGQEKPSSPQNWAFQPSGKQGMSLLDM